MNGDWKRLPRGIAESLYDNVYKARSLWRCLNALARLKSKIMVLVVPIATEEAVNRLKMINDVTTRVLPQPMLRAGYMSRDIGESFHMLAKTPASEAQRKSFASGKFQIWPYALRLTNNNFLRTDMAEYEASSPDDRVETMYLANRQELLAYGRTMKRKSEKFCTIRRGFMKLTDHLHGKLKAVNLCFKRFGLPRMQILFKSDGIRDYHLKKGIGRNQSRHSCDTDYPLKPFLYHTLYVNPHYEEEDISGGNLVHKFHPAPEYRS